MATGGHNEVTCNGSYCIHKIYGQTGWLCGYNGYCDYQCPKDSRHNMSFHQEFCLCAGQINTVGNCSSCGKKKQFN